jgi:flagellar biosynthesis protein FlhG
MYIPPSQRAPLGRRRSAADLTEARSLNATRAAAAPRREPGREPCVWAVGGGKGGVGKSVVTSSLAIALARRGQRCVVVDADLGGANLHTILGVPKPERTLTDFLSRRFADLGDVRCETPIANLSLISGAHALLEMANPKHSQKEKILRHIRSLDVDHVFLDLSAGSAFNVLDFFLAAERGLLVVVPEPTSIENAYHFLKAAFFRSLRIAARQGRVRYALDHVLRASAKTRNRSPRDLIAAVMDVDRAAGAALRDRALAFSPMLLLNQSRTPDDERVGRDISLACREHLGTEVDYLGALERDECVHDAVRNRRPVLQAFPHCRFAQDLEVIADRLARGENRESTAGLEQIEYWLGPRRSRLEREPLATYGLFADAPQPPGPTRRDSVSGATRATIGWSADLPALDLANPGAYLRRCRTHLGLQLPELARQTRIRYLESIENERFDELPPTPYVQGYVLQYARALGVRDAEALAGSFLDRQRRATQG